MHTFLILKHLSLLEIWKECLMREHTKQPYIICTSLVGRHDYSITLVFQCWVMVLVFQNILSFMKELKKHQILPHPHMGSYSGEKGHQFWHKPWILVLAKSVETFFMVSISDMPTIKY